MRRWRMGLVLAMLAVVACNALTGVSDLGVVSECDACDAASPPRSDEAGGEASDAALAADATLDASVPSYCRGIVFYARLDGTFTSAEGVAADTPPDASFGPGRFGAAATIVGDASTLFYPTSAAVTYPQGEGSLAMWFKPLWTTGQAVARSYFKPAGDKAFAITNNAGPQIIDFGNARGLGATSFNVDASYTEATLPRTTWTTGWHELDWNHFAASWRRTPSLIDFTLNGGDGVDAGVLHVETTGPWDPQVPTAAFLRFASAGNPLDGALDDLAVWNRVLPPAEVKAIYTASQSIGDACKL